MNDDSKIVSFAAAAKKRGRTLAGKLPPSVQITGNNNVGVAGHRNHVEINVKTTPYRRPKIVVQAGYEHITEAQAAEIHELVAKVVKVTGKPYAFVWPMLRKSAHCASYRLMLQSEFEGARTYLRKWIASATAAPTTQNGVAARKRLLARVHAEARKTPSLLDRVHEYTRGRFGTASLAELSPGQLDEVVRQFGF